MSEKDKREALKMLSEIFNVLSKYDDGVFNLAISFLKDKQITKSLELVKSKATRSMKKGEFISKAEAERKEVIALISSKLRSRDKFPTLDSMRNFMKNQSVIGIELLDLKTRHGLTRTYLEHVKSLPMERLKKINESLMNTENSSIDENNDRSLENWSKIILKKSKED
ncbi:hypothetical protein [Pantoea agglomerans]|uniref:hypothetical protein n=1 Tax=Enterobacter agglomerans TaxID=549 RepID=UPI00301E5741